MPNDTLRADRDPARNLQVVLVLAGIGYTAWSWAGFSGPFRWLVDLQLRLVGRYSEPVAGVATAVVVVATLVLALVLVRRAYPDLTSRAADALVAAVFVVASAAALWQTWHLWREAAHLPRPSDPVQIVDLDRPRTAAFPTGHVRVIGTPDRQRQVLGYATGRTGLSSYWESWVPLVPKRQGDAMEPVRIVATARGRDRVSAAGAIGDDPQGLLLFDSVDTRTVYQARQEGLDMPEHAFALYTDERVRSDTFIDAGLLGAFVALFWGLAAWSRITGRSGRVTPAASSSPDEIAVDAGPGAPAASAVPAPAAAVEAEPMLMRLGMGGAVAAVGTGGLLWEMFGFLPTRWALVGYAAAAVVLAVSLLLMWLGQRSEAAAPSGEPPPALSAAMAAALAPPPGAALLCVLRDEPGANSPSYKRVDVDGAHVADLKANRYTVVALRPGPHHLAVNTRVSLTSDTVVRFDAAAGDVVVYRLQVPFFGALRLERTADGPAVRDVLARLKRVEPS